MSKNNRRLESFSSEKHKERKVNALSDLSTVVDRETLPVVVEQQMSYPAVDQSPAETGAPETAETIITTDATEAVANCPDVAIIDDEVA